MTTLRKRQRLSVVVLTKNEESNIAACLESVKWADEIIVMDDNSTDKTIDIARRYTDKVIVSSMDRDFAKQRNLSISYCSGDWILQMDADERVTAELKNKIANLLENGSDFAAFSFIRMNNFCGKFLKFGGEGSHKSLRLFKAGMARFHGRDDRIEVSGKVCDWDAVMEHYNSPSIEHYVLTQNFYSQTEAEDLNKSLRIISKKQLRKELISGPIKLFFKIYIKRKGFKDGIHGLVFAVLSAWRRFLIYAKYWELNKESYR